MNHFFQFTYFYQVVPNGFVFQKQKTIDFFTHINMKRRDFLTTTSAGLTAICLGSSLWSCTNNSMHEAPTPFDFRPYRTGKTIGETWIVTPEDGFFTNTYYDVNPWSPSGRYLALTELPYQDRITVLGDLARVVVIDLKERTIRRVYTTKMWGYQMGAILHWGMTDRYLYCNDVLENGRGVGVKLDLYTGQTLLFEGPKYDLDAQNHTAIGPCMEYLNITQYSYGTPAAKADKNSFQGLPVGASPNEGLWETDIRTGKRRLLLSLKEAAQAVSQPKDLGDCTFYFFHTKYNADKSKMMLVLRCPYPIGSGRNGRNPVLLSCKRDGSNPVEAVSLNRWAMGGHHPTWLPDGEHILMNLTPRWLGDEKLRFCKFKADGSDFQILSQKFLGSGHPSMHPEGRFLLSDAYPFEPLAVGNGEIPIRLIDLEQEKEYTVATIFTDLGKAYKMKRFWGPSKLDAHPVWNQDFTQICFNGAPNGKRQVLITDLGNFLF